MNRGSAKLIGVSALLASMVLVACSGGGGGGGGSGNTAGLSGTAATGTPIVGKIVAIDKNGLVFTGTTSATGAYTINVASPVAGVAPFILTVTGTAGGKAVTLNSVATAATQTVNITPLTDMIVSTAANQPGGSSLGSLCAPDAAGAVSAACTAALNTATTGTNLTDAVNAVKTIIAPLNTSNADPLNGAFVANGTGMDAVLDQIVMSPATSQGGVATVTLVAVPGATLGSVTLGTSTVAAGTATNADITAATSAQTALSEIQSCLANLSALYPANMTAAPSLATVQPFFDTSFMLNTNLNYSAITTKLSTLAPSGLARPERTFSTSGFTKFDFTKQTGNSLLNTTSAYNAVNNTAWIELSIDGGVDNQNWKMVKTADTSGCAGGWKIVGNDHMYTGVFPRVSKDQFGGTTSYSRHLSLQIPTVDSAVANNVAYAAVSTKKNGVDTGGLRLFTGNGTLGAATTIIFQTPQVPATGTRQQFMGMMGQMSTDGGTINFPAGSYYYNAEAIESCQDLNAKVNTLTTAQLTAGIPCFDETIVTTGTIFKYSIFNVGNATAGTATPVADYSYPMRLAAVPLSQAYMIANDKDLFAQNITATKTVDQLNTAAASYSTGAALDDLITFNYTLSSVYGARIDNCDVGLVDAAANLVLNAEQDMSGSATSATSCTFNTNGLNFGSLAKPAVPFAATATSGQPGRTGWMGVAGNVLGNQATSALPYL